MRGAAALVTGPINKQAMQLAGADFPGHTELLAARCGVNEVVMMLAGERLPGRLVAGRLGRDQGEGRARLGERAGDGRAPIEGRAVSGDGSGPFGQSLGKPDQENDQDNLFTFRKFSEAFV